MTTEPLNAVSALQRASALCDLRRWDDAASALRTILATDPHNARGLCLLAQAQIGQAAHDQALRSSMAAIAENPEGEWPHRLASLALSGLGRHQEAAEMARNGVRLAPHSAPCHITLAQVLAKRGSDLVEARAAADRAVSLAPLDAGSHMAVGMVAAKDARIEEATTSYQRALALEPDNWVALNELARLMPQGSRFDSGGLARAAGRYASAVRANPRAAVSRSNIDVVLHNFLAQTTRWIFLIATIATWVRIQTDTGLVRLAPALLLVLPALFAARFAVVLAPSTRRYLRGRLRERLLARVVVCDALASAGLVVGAASQRAGAIAFGFAASFGLLALLTLRVSVRLHFPVSGGRPSHDVVTGDTGMVESSGSTPCSAPDALARARAVLDRYGAKVRSTDRDLIATGGSRVMYRIMGSRSPKAEQLMPWLATLSVSEAEPGRSAFRLTVKSNQGFYAYQGTPTQAKWERLLARIVDEVNLQLQGQPEP
jgi:tetratricopeptide (TPR) repeat protein